MNTTIDLTSQIFGRWTVLELDFTRSAQTFWLCQCECGTKKVVSSHSLQSGTSKSCGCLKIELSNRRKLSPEQMKANRAAAAAVKDKTPERREQKRLTQMRYVVSDKALLAFLKRWLKKRKNKIILTDQEFLEFRKKPCTLCDKPIEGLGLGFSLIYPRRTIELSNMLPMCGVCKHIKNKDKFDPIAFSKNILRRFWKRTPMVAITTQKARRGRGAYECASCKNVFSNSAINIDHREPVVDVHKGYQNLDEFATRLFCDDNNLQILCKDCHLTKTLEENRLREETKAKNKIKDE